MSLLVPRRPSGNLTNGRSLFGDSFFAPFFDMGDMFGSCGFRVDVKDEKDHYALEAELPGVPKEQIEVSVDNGVLTIAANMNSEKKTEKDNYVYSERKTGRFQRSFNLEGIREQDIKADYKDGILKLELPKAQPAAQPSRRLIDIGDSAN